jgi:hypothetical protein
MINWLIVKFCLWNGGFDFSSLFYIYYSRPLQMPLMDLARESAIK